MLVGYDLKKDASILEAAYDDRTGVTAAFNKNLLARMNRELDADFDLDAFTCRATYDHMQGAINSYLVSARSQSVRIGAARLTVPFAVSEGAFWPLVKASPPKAEVFTERASFRVWPLH